MLRMGPDTYKESIPGRVTSSIIPSSANGFRAVKGYMVVIVIGAFRKKEEVSVGHCSGFKSANEERTAE